MPVHWTISHPSKLVVAVAKQDVTVADIEKYFAGVTAAGGMSYRKIFEITHTPSALSEENVRALGKRVVYYAQHGQVGPVAIVASTEESFVQAQLFASTASVSRPLMIFRELHSARRWLDGQLVSSA
jgi:hypothetical protein